MMEPLTAYERMLTFREGPKRPTMKHVFSTEKISKEKIIKQIKMVKKVHSKSREELKKMKVTELKALIKKHNLHNAIKGYTKMKKVGLVDALMLHSRKPDDDTMPAELAPAPPPKRGRGRPKKMKVDVPLPTIPEMPVKRGRGRPRRKTAGKAAKRLVEA